MGSSLRCKLPHSPSQVVSRAAAHVSARSRHPPSPTARAQIGCLVSLVPPPALAGASTERVRRPADRAPSAFTALAKAVQDAGLMRRRYGYYWAKLNGA